jgi:flagellar motor switch protein FliN/FliY
MPEDRDNASNLAVLRNVELELTVELGRARMPVRALLALTSGDVIELDRHANAPVDVLVNGTLVAKGEVVVVDDEFGVRILEIVSPDEVDQLTRGA